ncbi:MAG: ABC transporter ATP-binding protein [Gammaproteobacteria bacterium]|nr:ABC transporter ATP-binding protein [Gammaproteobacteria bacterium]
MSAHALLDVQRVSFGYASQPIIRDLSFSVQAGEVLGFLGRNGAGKSTTMALLSGVLEADSGDIVVAGASMRSNPRTAKSRLGYLPEHPPLFVDLTVSEYLLYCAGLRHLRGAHAKRAVTDMLDTCNLGTVAHRLIAKLSKGFQQRVGIAQALIHAPDVVLLDEPTAGLDPIEFRNLRDLIRRLGQNHAVVLSSHILTEVTQTCDRVMIMNEGRLVTQDTTAERSHFRIALRRDPGAADLAELSGVIGVEALTGGWYRVEASADAQMPEQLVAAAHQHDWGLFHLAEENQLEDAFLRLASAEVSGA